MLVLSDIHFNPTANKSLVDRLAIAAPEQWDTILAEDTSRLSGYGEDANWKLLASALAVLKTQPRPDFVLVTGDFLAHQFRAHFDAAAADHSDAAFRAFAAKTMRFLALKLEANFPSVRILPALGNNDDTCGDYQLRPGGPFLADTAGIVEGLVGPDTLPSFERSWRALGNYVVPNPAVKDHLIAVINTNYFSLHYKNACGTPADGNPAVATLAWLRHVLSEAETAHRKVWLAYHIPPGIDAFATARHNACPISPVPMFAAPYDAQFHALMERYRATVTASFAGHIHMDGFRLFSEDGKPFGFVVTNPAISPIFGQNPAFRRIALADDGTLIDQSVYYLANLRDAQSGAEPRWQLEMSFDSAWNQPRFGLSSLQDIYRQIGTVAEARDRWFKAYAVQSDGPAVIRPADYAIYRCAAGQDRAADVARCSCAGAAQ
jgi:hypothetical protein